MMDRKFVSIIVPTFRRPDVLPETLEMLARLDYPQEKYEVIVVDDGSNDSTAEVAAEFKNKIKNLIYHFQENKGVATARNTGARLAKGEILIFNDDDIIVSPDVIERHLKILEKYGKCLVNGHWEFAPEMTADLEESPFGRFRLKTEVWVKTGIDKIQLENNLYEPNLVTACNLGIRREDFWEIGGFDEQFPHAGCEDQEFSLRAKRARYRFCYDYDLKLWHNDRRLTLEQFGERQRRGAITKVLMAVKFPAEIANHPMITENGKILPGEALKTSVKKIVKKIFATSLGLRLLLGVTNFLERNQKSDFLRTRLYESICGFYIFKGIREGIKLYGYPGEKQTRNLSAEQKTS